jgi:hypothetical protein
MSYQSKDRLEMRRFLVVLGVLALVMAMTDAAVPSTISQDNGEKKTPAPKATPEKSKTDAKGNRQKPQASGHDTNRAKGQKDQPPISPAEKKRLAMSLLDGVLVGTDKIEPVEYGILVQVEAATLLWPLDKERSVAILTGAVKTMRGVLSAEKQSKEKNAASKNRESLRSLALRKIAALKPDLLKNLSVDSTPDDKTRPALLDEWTPEARALISVALDQVDKDPKMAAQLAEQTMSLGMVDWTYFLNELNRRDAGGAERLATTLINRMRGSSFDPVAMINLQGFMLASGRSSALKGLFFQSVAAQLRQSVRPDKADEDLNVDLYYAKMMLALAASHSLNGQAEFANIVSTIEAMFTQRSLAVAGPPVVKIVDPSAMSRVRPGDSMEIASALSRVEAINNTKARDKEYRQLAVKAGLKTDLSLAESIVSKIEDDAIRRDTITQLYKPLVRKAIEESTWSYAQTLTLKVQDPLVRTLLFDRIAQAMARAHEDRSLVMDVYRLATTTLDHEDATQPVAKAFLTLAKSLWPVDPAAGTDAVNSAIAVLNKIARRGELFEEPSLWEAVNSLVNPSNYVLSADDILVLPEMLGDVFREMAKRDASKSVMIADGLAHRGLYSVAHLAISKTLLEAIRSPETTRAKPPKPLAFSPIQWALLRQIRLS